MSMRAAVLIEEKVEVNPPEQSRSYSSIWSNEKVGGVHARSMLNSQ